MRLRLAPHPAYLTWPGLADLRDKLELKCPAIRPQENETPRSEPGMNRDRVLNLLGKSREELRTRFGVGSISLYGSYARDEARPDSDVDLLVEFESPPTFLGYMGLIEFLEELLDTHVDLATREKLKPRVRPFVERDLIRVA